MKIIGTYKYFNDEELKNEIEKIKKILNIKNIKIEVKNNNIITNSNDYWLNRKINWLVGNTFRYKNILKIINNQQNWEIKNGKTTRTVEVNKWAR